MVIAEIIKQLSPRSRKLAESFIVTLAEQDGIHCSLENSYKAPLESMPLWTAFLLTEGKSEGTIKTYEHCARGVLKRVADPTYMNLQAYFAQRLKEVSDDQVNSEQKAIRSLFKYLYKNNLYGCNPTEDIKPIRPHDAIVECPDPDVVWKLFNVKLLRPRDTLNYRVMLFLLINTGLRITEACSLRKDYIDWRNLRLRVIGKGDKERLVPISDIVARLLKGHIEQSEYPDSPYVFPGETKTGYWDTSGFRGELTTACKQAEIKHIHPHQLRHLFATMALEDGAKLEVISKILGHADVGITAKVYRHVSAKEFSLEHAKHNPLALAPDSITNPLMLTDGKTVEGEAREITDDNKIIGG